MGFKNNATREQRFFLKTSPKVKTSLKVGFAVILIYWMVREGALDLGAFAEISSLGVIGFCVAAVFVQIFVNNFRWLCLLRAQGFVSSIRHTLPLSLIGMFFNFAMPGGVGGDVVKGYYLLQDYPRQKFAGAMSIFMDRMMGFFVMIATAFMALIFNWPVVARSAELRSVGIAVTALLAGFVAFFALSLSRRLSRRLSRYFLGSLFGRLLFETLPGGSKLRAVYETFHSYRKAPGALVKAFALSLINQAFIVAFVFVIGQAMGVTEIPLSVYFFLVPIGVVIQALPISPAGIGVGQAAFYFLFNLYLGHESQLGPTAVTVMQIINFGWGLVGAYFYLQRKKPVSAV